MDLLDLRFLEATPDSVAAQDGTSDRYTLVNAGARSHRRRRTAAKLAPSIASKIVRDAGYDALAVGRKIIAELQADLGFQPPNLRKAPCALTAQGLVEQHGGRGQATWYERANSRQ